MILLSLLAILGLTVGVAVYFVRRDRGAKEPISMLWAAFGFGGLAVVLTVLINDLALPLNFDQLITQPAIKPDLSYVLLGSLIVGITEEMTKAVPLAFFVFKKSYFNEHTDGVVYFAISGLCFSLLEDILYTLMLGGGIGLLRLVIAPFFHAALCGIFGFYLVRYKITGRPKTSVLLALLSIIGLHALYDFGLLSHVPLLALLSIVITILVNVSLFTYYTRATKLDRGLGLSTVGSNNYCRHCGQANPKHNLFCSQCGQKA